MSRLMLAGLVLVGAAGAGQASFTLTVTNNGNPVAVAPIFAGTPSAGESFSQVLIPQTGAVLTVSSNGSQLGTSSGSLQTTVSLTNTAPGATALSNLVVTVTETGFTLPSSQYSTRFIPSASVIAGSASGVVLNTSINAFAPAGFTFNAASPLVPSNSPSDANVTALTGAGFTPTQITQTFTIGSLVVGGQLSTSIQTSLSQVPTNIVPVPATALALVAGLPLLGIGARLRRRVVA